MLTNEQFTSCVQQYIDMVYRVAINCVKSPADADDVTQNVFLKLLKANIVFSGDEHIRNWLIRVTVNECKDLARKKWWRQESYEDYAATLVFNTNFHSDLFYAVMELPKKYRLPIYLHYYEGYSTREIAEILRCTKNTVCTQLKRGRELLKKTLTEVDEYV